MKLKAAIITVVFVMVATAFIATSSPEMADGASEVEWTINSAEDLNKLSESIQNVQAEEGDTAYYYANVQLNADIALNSNWKGLGDENHVLRGKFYGNNHTITLKGTEYGLMNYAGPIEVQNLRIVENRTAGPALVYVLYGSLGSTTVIKNVVVDGITTWGKGFISYAYPVESHTSETPDTPEIKIIECVNNAEIDVDSDNRGVGILGTIKGVNVLIEGCRNNGDITLNNTGEAHAAGIAGYLMNNGSAATPYITIRNCVNYGNISAASTSDGRENVGGIASTLHQGKFVIENCNNYGTITGNNSGAIKNQACAGGIVGRANTSTSINGCVNYGKIEGISSETNANGKAYAGGIVGYVDTQNIGISNCKSFGTVSSSGGTAKKYSGQITGHVRDAAADTFSISSISIPSDVNTLDGEKKYDSTSTRVTGLITVDMVEPATITVNPASVTMVIDGGQQLVYTVPEESTKKSVTWSSDPSGIVFVNSGGYLLALSEGTTTITVTTSDGLTATCQVTVTKADDGSKDQKPTTTTTTDPSGTTTTVIEYPDGSKTTIVEDSTKTSTTTETKTSVADATSTTTISTTTVVVKNTDDEVTSAEAKVNVEVETDTSTESAPVEITEDLVTTALGTISLDAESEAVLTKTVTVTADTAQISLTAEATKAVSDSGAKLEFVGSAGTMTADTDVVETLASQGYSLTISFVEVNDVVLPDTQQTIEDATAYRLTVTRSDGITVHELNGTVDLTVEYEPPTSVSAAEVVVIYVADNGTMEAMATTYNPDTKILKFSTDHFSYFMVGTLGMLDPDVDPPIIIPDDDEYIPPYIVPTKTENNDDDSKKVLACAAAAVVAALMAAFLVVDRKR